MLKAYQKNLDMRLCGLIGTNSIVSRGECHTEKIAYQLTTVNAAQLHAT